MAVHWIVNPEVEGPIPFTQTKIITKGSCSSGLWRQFAKLLDESPVGFESHTSLH